MKNNHYKKRKPRSKPVHTRLWNETDMVAAVRAVNSGEMSQRAAQTTFNVPRATLQTRLNGKVTLDAKPGRASRFTYQQERKLVDYSCNRADMGVGFGKKQFLIYAGQYGKKYGVKFKGGKPSNKWRCGMLKRHPDLRLRKPEPTAAVRHQCMDKKMKEPNYFVLTSKEVIDIKLKQKHDKEEKEREKVKRKLQRQLNQAAKATNSTSKKGARNSANTSREAPKKSSRAKLKKTVTKEKKNDSNNEDQSDDENYFCIYCQEKYTNPPSEDWIQSCVCTKWCHEECSNKLPGKHICDLCRKL